MSNIWCWNMSSNQDIKSLVRQKCKVNMNQNVINNLRMFQQMHVCVVLYQFLGSIKRQCVSPRTWAVMEVNQWVFDAEDRLGENLTSWTLDSLVRISLAWRRQTQILYFISTFSVTSTSQTETLTQVCVTSQATVVFETLIGVYIFLMLFYGRLCSHFKLLQLLNS